MTVTSQKTYDLEGGNKIHAKRLDPYGMIHLNGDRGPLPETLMGAFTSYDEAERAINAYLVVKNKSILEIKRK